MRLGVDMIWAFVSYFVLMWKRREFPEKTAGVELDGYGNIGKGWHGTRGTVLFLPVKRKKKKKGGCGKGSNPMTAETASRYLTPATASGVELEPASTFIHKSISIVTCHFNMYAPRYSLLTSDFASPLFNNKILSPFAVQSTTQKSKSSSLIFTTNEMQAFI